MDQRIENTYSALQTEMRQMLGNTPWHKISVQALCDSAGISRTTFYSHFTDKENLLDSLLEMFEQALLSDNNGRALSDNQEFKFLPMFLNHVNGNRRLFAKTNTSPQGYPVAIRFRSMLERLVSAELDQSHRPETSKPVSARFLAGGIYSLVIEWCEKSDDETHLKLLAEIDQYVKKLL